MNIIYLVVSGACSAIAGLFLKISSSKALALIKVSELYSKYLFVSLALTCYAIGFVFYYLGLKKINLSTAYPIMIASAVIFIITIETFFLKEQLSIIKLISLIMLVLAIALLKYA